MKSDKRNYKWLIVGLGNIGKRYAHTRHNYGFLAINKYLQENGGGRWKKKNTYYYSCLKEFGILCAKPRTMMNLSGIAVARLARKYGFPPDKILVLYDDLDINLGQIRIRPHGGHGGHKGIMSIIDYLDTTEFPRIRLGIGAPGIDDVISYVLEDFGETETGIVEKVLKIASEAIDVIIQENATEAMNKYNNKKIT
ncbi:MAG: aminoacyl-tRNA hydrolase [Acidobacteria bacterium]|nr:aminoacyl-tRNA hydrolase [Acidobacteriota bacterium]